VNLYPFLAYVFVTTFTPGPNNVMSMSNAMRFGYRGTLRFLAGITCGFLVVMLICGLLDFGLVSLAPQVKLWLNILGAVYMVYLAVHIVRSKPVDGDPAGAGLNSFRAGFMMQFLNVKVILYGVTVFSTFIVQAYHDPLTVSLFAPILAGIGFISISCWAIGGNLFRSLLFKYYRLFNLAMGALLVYTAVASFI